MSLQKKILIRKLNKTSQGFSELESITVKNIIGFNQNGIGNVINVVFRTTLMSGIKMKSAKF